MGQTDKKKCTSCKNMFSKHWGITLVSLYMTFAAIYGTIELVKIAYTYLTH